MIHSPKVRIILGEHYNKMQIYQVKMKQWINITF